MNTGFSAVVEEAIEVLYYSYDIKRADEIFKKLKQAVEEGDADAMYLLARCYAGGDFCWEHFGFPEDDDEVEKYMRMSILSGSAIGVVGAMRTGMLSKELEEKMPFINIKEAWHIIYKKAKAGNAFCQNMIGNTYYWLDIVRIEGREAEQFSNWEEWINYLRKMTLESIPWYEEALRHRMGIAGRNLVKLYKKGNEDLHIKAQPEKAVEVAKLGAEVGIPEWQSWYGSHLTGIPGREKEGLHYCRCAVEAGDKSGWYELAYAYKKGRGVQKDLKKALEYAEKGIGFSRDFGCCWIAGRIYFEGAEGIPKNYERAFKMFERARAQGETFENDYLAVCYVMGYGCQKNPEKAKELLEEIDYSSEYTDFVWGLLYTEGLGVEKDIKEGISYWENAKGCPLVDEAMAQYKKTWFGGWKRCSREDEPQNVFQKILKRFKG